MEMCLVGQTDPAVSLRAWDQVQLLGKINMVTLLPNLRAALCWLLCVELKNKGDFKHIVAWLFKRGKKNLKV